MRRWLAVAALLMVLATRLLMASGGTGAFAPPATIPPFDASWSRSGANPILVPSVAWEGAFVQEPTVLYESGTWKMWYTGGSSPSTYGMGYATSSDGISWTKYAGNPVIGQGGSGISGPASRNNVVHVGATYYAYYSDASGNLKVTTSSDGIAWGTPTTVFAFNAASFATGWVNLAVWNEGGTNWHMLIEAVGATANDRIVAATTSMDGLTWATPATSGIASLEISGGQTAGPSVFMASGLYHLWYHASNGYPPGLPTDIYHASSSDLASWTVSPGTPVLTHTGSGFEVDQVADPSVLVVAGTAYLFYTGADNVGGHFKIGVATAPATH